jgi:hypothetical protein
MGSSLTAAAQRIFQLLAMAALLWARRRARVSDWLVFIAFSGAALSASRNIVLIGLTAPIMIAAYAPWKLRVPAATPYAFAFLLIGGLGAGIARGTFFQFHVAEWRVPKGAADFLAQHHITQPMFNTYEYGGYLMWRAWPEERPFIDGRALSEAVFQDYARILYNHDASDGLPSADDLVARYGIQVILMNTFEATTGPLYLLAPALADPAPPKLVYNDPQALIFAHAAPGRTALNSLDVLTHMEDECSLHLAHEPQYPALRPYARARPSPRSATSSVRENGWAST